MCIVDRQSAPTSSLWGILLEFFGIGIEVCHSYLIWDRDGILGCI